MIGFRANDLYRAAAMDVLVLSHCSLEFDRRFC
jgi:hypothetical protein